MDAHFIDASGNHFVVPDTPDGYAPAGATPIAAPPTPDHRWANGEWRVPQPSLQTVAELVTYLDQRMIEVETGGTIWNGVAVSTTERAQVKMDAALASYADGTRAANQMVTFIAADGSPQVIDQATLLSIKQAVVDHVAGSFTAYGVIHPQIIAGTITTREAIRDHVEWPSNA